MDELRIMAAVETIENLSAFLSDLKREDDRNNFNDKWGPQLEEVGSIKKKVLGDDWDEGAQLFDYATKSLSEGVSPDEIDATIKTYFENEAARLHGLAIEAETPEESAALEQAAETMELAADEQTPEGADVVIAIDEETPEEDDDIVELEDEDNPAYKHFI